MPDTSTIAETHSAGEKMKAWRIARKLSTRQLAALTGFSEPSIRNFESGIRSDGVQVSGSPALRYRLCCAAIDAGVTDFDWEVKP